MRITSTMSATQRKVRSREHDNLCFLGEKPCQSLDQATKLFELHSQINELSFFSSRGGGWAGRNGMKDSIKLLTPLGRGRKIADPLLVVKISSDPPPPHDHHHHHHQKFLWLRVMSCRGHDMQRSLPLSAGGLEERCEFARAEPWRGSRGMSPQKLQKSWSF